MVSRLSIELTRRCAKACAFCYNGSTADGDTRWSTDDVATLVDDCIAHGTLAVSFGGGEPTDHPGLFDLLERFRGRVFRSFTTHGLGLDAMLDAVVAAQPDKVHVSIHHPDRDAEVARVARQVGELERRGIRSGVNLLVARSRLDAARAASAHLRDAGIGVDRIVFLPMRGADTPAPDEMGVVAGTPRFQSVSCLAACGPSPRFASLAWDRSVAWCSYTTARRPLEALSYAALVRALDGLGIDFCGPPRPRTALSLLRSPTGLAKS